MASSRIFLASLLVSLIIARSECLSAVARTALGALISNDCEELPGSKIHCSGNSMGVSMNYTCSVEENESRISCEGTMTNYNNNPNGEIGRPLVAEHPMSAKCEIEDMTKVSCHMRVGERFEIDYQCEEGTTSASCKGEYMIPKLGYGSRGLVRVPLNISCNIDESHHYDCRVSQ
ncbi:hypothetical protein Ddc_12582 [Ditylenchus destructor]|nr:hypothetical protein Ddc_12582 [Ditylenchus destructor]